MTSGMSTVELSIISMASGKLKIIFCLEERERESMTGRGKQENNGDKLVTGMSRG